MQDPLGSSWYRPAVTAEWPDNLVGEVLAERFEIKAVLGKGGMGVVFSAVQKSLNRDVVIKMLRPELVRDPTNFERFHREASLAANAGTSGVVDVIDLATDRMHGPFMVMERLRGQSLVEVLQGDGRVDLAEALWVATELLDILSVVHQQGIVHRDLKPPNVFIHVDPTGDESLKILDFGIAKLQQHSLTLTGQLVGTPRYMSPEQALGEKVDHRTDIYATGLLLYAALTGLPPYASIPSDEVILRIHKGPPSLRTLCPDLDPTLLDIVDRALSPKKEDRYQSAKEMATALRSLTVEGMPAPELLAGVSLLSAEEHAAARAHYNRPSVPSVPPMPLPQTGNPTRPLRPKKKFSEPPVEAAEVAQASSPSQGRVLGQGHVLGLLLVLLIGALATAALIFVLYNNGFFLSRKPARVQGESVEVAEGMPTRPAPTQANRSIDRQARQLSASEASRGTIPSGYTELRTTPEGASVFVNGVFTGSTPLRIAHPSSGDLDLELRLPGYANAQFLVTSQTTPIVEIELRPPMASRGNSGHAPDPRQTSGQSQAQPSASGHQAGPR